MTRAPITAVYSGASADNAAAGAKRAGGANNRARSVLGFRIWSHAEVVKSGAVGRSSGKLIVLNRLIARPETGSPLPDYSLPACRGQSSERPRSYGDEPSDGQRHREVVGRPGRAMRRIAAAYESGRDGDRREPVLRRADAEFALTGRDSAADLHGASRFGSPSELRNSEASKRLSSSSALNRASNCERRDRSAAGSCSRASTRPIATCSAAA
jgi:hypothetical protein